MRERTALWPRKKDKHFRWNNLGGPGLLSKQEMLDLTNATLINEPLSETLQEHYYIVNFSCLLECTI